MGSHGSPMCIWREEGPWQKGARTQSASQLAVLIAVRLPVLFTALKQRNLWYVIVSNRGRYLIVVKVLVPLIFSYLASNFDFSKRNWTWDTTEKLQLCHLTTNKRCICWFKGYQLIAAKWKGGERTWLLWDKQQAYCVIFHINTS